MKTFVNKSHNFSRQNIKTKNKKQNQHQAKFMRKDLIIKIEKETSIKYKILLQIFTIFETVQILTVKYSQLFVILNI